MSAIQNEEGQPILLEKNKSLTQGAKSGTEKSCVRWIYLLLFVFVSAANGFNWVELTIITDIVEEYYDVSRLAVTWTSMLYFVPYIPLIFPATWYLQTKGLRSSIILGAFGTCLGCWTKVFGINKSGFPIVFTGQVLTAMSEVFILGIPSELAANWFPSTQVSLACAIGVFGNQMGVALGFLLPPIFVKNYESLSDLSWVVEGLFDLFISQALITTILLILIVLILPNQQSTVKCKNKNITKINHESSNADRYEKFDYSSSIKRLLSNNGFQCLLIAYGVLVGIFYAISSLLNATLLLHFKNIDTSSGRIGFIIVVCGMFGSIICGRILDKTHEYKGMTVAIYGLSFLGMIFYLFAIYLNNLKLIYISAGVLGFFMTGYLPVGFEFGVEMTYPESEGTSSGLLNASAKVFGLIFTFGGELVMAHYDDTLVHVIMTAALFICTIITCFIRFSKERQKANTNS